MEVAGEMQVDLVHRQHLRIAASACAPFHSEAWTERWLSQYDSSFFPDFIQTECKTDADCGFSDSGLGRADGGDENEVGLLGFLIVNTRKWNFGHVVSVRFQFVFIHTQFLGNFFNSLKISAVGYFNVGLHRD